MITISMVIGVTMINVLPGYEKAAYRELRNLEGIKDVYHVFGQYDFVVIIEVEDLSTLNSVVDRIRESETVTATQTIVGAEL
jgi:DNA-binding Lrp family transcriptional regulator